MAHYIHRRSPRADKPFVAVNCAAIPENLLESELFGYEKGAFTGAVSRRIGKFEEANGGTLLLDEISEMDLRLQAKLLRAIQEQEIDRIGGKTPIKVNVRIIATSNRNMPEEVANGAFREDLYFRLNVITIEMPRLADRPEDISLLAQHFAEKYAEENNLGEITLSSGALQQMQAYAWPGNVRELENTMHRGVLMAADGVVSPEILQLQGGSADSGMPAGASATTAGINLVGKTVAEVEQGLIIDTLEHCLGNRTHAAKILGISIRTLRNKLKQYNEQGVAVPVPGDGGEHSSL